MRFAHLDSFFAIVLFPFSGVQFLGSITDVMCPVALDEAWKDCRWPERLREQIMEYNIMDFSNWRDEKEFERKFGKLIEGLNLFYKEK
jgi:hypothetical protein